MSQTIVVSGGNCYDLAEQYYGDATAFVVIMAANGLSDPFISGVTTLVIPSPDPSVIGGVLPIDASYPYGYTEGSLA
jgi:nucleoid-associated protein YgaU